MILVLRTIYSIIIIPKKVIGGNFIISIFKCILYTFISAENTQIIGKAFPFIVKGSGRSRSQDS